MDAGNLLKPMLARGELHCIGATTLDEYRKHIEKDAALERRFQPVLVDQPSVEDTISILRGLQGALRSPPRRPHQGCRPRRRRRPFQPLHLRPLPARQGHRPGGRSRREAAHRNRLHARRARRKPPPHHAARNRARSPQEGNRRCLARAPRQDRRGAGRPQSRDRRLKAQWQAEKDARRTSSAHFASRSSRPNSRSSKPSAPTTSTRPPNSSTAT